ncbi:uridine diphosphate glucose pyrophosphatase-like [Gouania willdenowi]|uniref:uridine diphosphate glucose pyrophosphatase-like n=1 Tax=Gouania willdenowi TaxID=441366 RepID=UPI001054E285|nr:uridine diphosphate glucose pyrophosphatase-like [Gouania willdenowi]XP_028315539.1 uridine diphosphate glucose pyrophosphatase-like [Gouania willdenowi]XP_028315586.1 uridine diphosphate glucose pyrophosphatase-like [Gouania willdenowi]XP_028315589.1 uridine diphosphate glucose pyrophosphatase-like [Gouania willdenowi]
MDPEVSVLLHCAQWKGLLQTQVHVELSERFNRQTDPALERHIEEVWTARLAKEPWLFNGTKFRLHSFSLMPSKHPLCPHEDQTRQTQCDSDLCAAQSETKLTNCMNDLQRESKGDVPSIRPLLTLTLGLTCYKDYLGTNWSSQVEELRQRGEVEYGDPLALLAQPLGVGAVLFTHDGHVVLIRRSQRVAEAGGQLDIPGGHPEPEAVSECPVTMATLQQRPEAVVSELFSSVCAEIRDEVNVPLCSLTAPILMGVALNHTSAGRPSAEFYVSCSLTSDEVRSLYWKGGAEAHESTDIVFLSRTELEQLHRSSPLWSELCPSAKGAVMLYQRVRPDGDQSMLHKGTTAH